MVASLFLLLARLVDLLGRVLILLVVVDVVLHYLMSPYHPLRLWLDRLILPLLRPLRRLIPPLGGFDFTPVVLILIIEVIVQVLVRVLVSLAFHAR